MSSSSDQENKFFELLSNGNLSEISNFLMKPSLPCIMDFTQKDNFTVLHFVASNSKFALAKYIIDYCKDNYNPTPEELKSWLEQTTNSEKLTCTHMAILSGQLKIVELFLANGADLCIKTRSGMTPMHLAAKTDQILIMAWLREVKTSDQERIFSIQEPDHNDFTPLHYSAMLSCELSTSILLSWGVSVKKVNKKGHTPLHLAVTSGSQRIVRSLLIKGADPYAKDYGGKSPLDEALQAKKEEIISLVKPPGWLSLCGIKPPQRPVTHRKILFSVFVFFLFTGMCLVFLAYKPKLERYFLGVENDEIEKRDIESTAFMFYECLCLAEILTFLLASQISPGYLKKEPETKLKQLAEKYESTKICFNCFIKRVPRSRHCLICNLCVERFDHHCPWINNCIGARNFAIFYVFLLITCVFIPYTAYFCILFVILCITDSEGCYNMKFFSALAVTGICSLFLVLVYMLFAVQTRNLLTNTTTNERFSMKNKTQEKDRSFADTRIDRKSVLSNALEMCCNLSERGSKEHRVGDFEPLLDELNKV